MQNGLVKSFRFPNGNLGRKNHH